jgi:hypothetical protein
MVLWQIFEYRDNLYYVKITDMPKYQNLLLAFNFADMLEINQAPEQIRN